MEAVAIPQCNQPCMGGDLVMNYPVPIRPHDTLTYPWIIQYKWTYNCASHHWKVLV